MPYPNALEKLIDQLGNFPGVGRRTAERLAFHVLRMPENFARELAGALVEARAKTVRCRHCYNITDQNPCRICSDPARNASQICVVEQPRDVDAIERAGCYRGVYHVLMGAWNPAEGTDREHLTMDALAARVRKGNITEIIVATDPDLEGDATALAVHEALRDITIRVSRLAKGLPSGTGIEYLNRAILADAFEGRRDL
ncbi:MAG: recombination protein RecR [Planctomycetes bacterium]|nr:recombination protein RecR [Planctomycetota bacterium]